MLEDHARPVLSLAVAGRRLFSGSYDYTIKVWSLNTLQRLKTLTGEILLCGTPQWSVPAHGAGMMRVCAANGLLAGLTVVWIHWCCKTPALSAQLSGAREDMR